MDDVVEVIHKKENDISSTSFVAIVPTSAKIRPPKRKSEHQQSAQHGLKSHRNLCLKTQPPWRWIMTNVTTDRNAYCKPASQSSIRSHGADEVTRRWDDSRPARSHMKGSVSRALQRLHKDEVKAGYDLVVLAIARTPST